VKVAGSGKWFISIGQNHWEKISSGSCFRKKNNLPLGLPLVGWRNTEIPKKKARPWGALQHLGKPSPMDPVVRETLPFSVLIGGPGLGVGSNSPQSHRIFFFFDKPRLGPLWQTNRQEIPRPPQSNRIAGPDETSKKTKPGNCSACDYRVITATGNPFQPNQKQRRRRKGNHE